MHRHVSDERKSRRARTYGRRRSLPARDAVVAYLASDGIHWRDHAGTSSNRNLMVASQLAKRAGNGRRSTAMVNWRFRNSSRSNATAFGTSWTEPRSEQPINALAPIHLDTPRSSAEPDLFIPRMFSPATRRFY